MTTQAPPGLESDHRLLREGVGLLERERGVIEVTGPDAVDFLQGQLTNDVAALAPGEGCYALLLNPKGRILGDARVLLRDPERVWLDTEPHGLETLLSNLTTYKIGRQVAVADRSGEWSVLSLIGPDAARAAGAGPQSLHSFLEIEVDGAAVQAIATETGVDVAAPRADAVRVRKTLADRGAEPASVEAVELMRIELGRPRLGVDMGEENLPGELGLEASAVSFTKGCYVGQEPVARMHHRGHPNRHLRGLRATARVEPGEPVLSGERETGSVTSASLSPLHGPVALAVLRREVEVGARVEVGDARTPATVVELPFVAR